MPLLDVSEILFDPDFVDTSLYVQRMSQTVGLDGIAINLPTGTRFTGVVITDSGDYIKRMAEGSLISGQMTIYTTFALQDGTKGFDADVVTWRGRNYTVTAVMDFSSYGRGVIAAVCTLLPLSG